MKKKLTALVFIALAAPGSALAAETLDWAKAVQEASQGNSELKAARESLEAALNSAKGAYSTLLPSLAATLDATRGTRGSISVSPVPGPPSNTYSASLTASEELFSGFRDRAKIEQASAQARLSESALQGTRSKVSSDLKTAYAGLVFAGRSISLSDSIIRRREDNAKLVQLRFESGRENKGSLLLAQAYLSQARFEAFQARNRIATASAELGRVLGRDSAEDLAASDEVPLSSPQGMPDFASIVPQTPAHLQAVAQRDVAESGITLSRAGFFPTLGVTGAFGRQGAEFFPQGEHWSIGASLTVPLFDGGRDYFALKSSRSAFESAADLERNVDRESLSKLKQTYVAFLEAREKLKVDRSFAEAATKRSQIARSKYNNGLLNFEDWDLIENDLITRQKTVIQSEHDETSSEAAWELAQGKGVIQ